ncbi:methyltransferase [Nonomuraea polychroma]|uniref:methyltransferase n=1 Tax=Nonomuraea polychroma TaxID=46176 RepID=UPI003D9407C6
MIAAVPPINGSDLQDTNEAGRQYLQSFLDGQPLLAALITVCRLRLPERLADSPATADELASWCTSTLNAPDLNAEYLERILRVAHAYGWVQCDQDLAYSLTEAGTLLVPDAPNSMVPAVITRSFELWRQAAASMYDTVVTGTPVALDDCPTLYDWLDRQPPTVRDTFDAFMASRSSLIAPAIADLDLSGKRSLIDLGGGKGILLATLLRKHPNLLGFLVERGRVAQAARDYLAQDPDLAGRHQVLERDLFRDGIPPRFKPVYVLSSVLHNLGDDQAVTLLERIAKTMRDTGDAELWVAECVRPERPEPHPSMPLDLLMLTLTYGGKERTVEELARLLHYAGLSLLDVRPLPAGQSLLIARI